VAGVAGMFLVVQAVPGTAGQGNNGGNAGALATASKVVAVVVGLVQLGLAPTTRLMMVIPAALGIRSTITGQEFFTQAVAVLEEQLGLRHMEFRGQGNSGGRRRAELHEMLLEVFLPQAGK